MAKQVKQLSPLLTVFEASPGFYSIRLSEISRRATFLSIEVAKLLPDAQSLQIITPNDMKVFDLTAEPLNPKNEAEPVLDSSEPEVVGQMPQPMEMDKVVEIAEQEEQRINGEEKDKRFRTPKPRVGKVAGFDEPCQRCQGNGTVEMLMEGGRAATGVCPVCQGEKVVRRFGARR